MVTAAERFGEFVAGIGLPSIPEPVQATAALHALDTLGCGLAAFALDAAPYATALLEAGTRGPSTGIGSGALPARDAAFLNGTLCHALDFDDTHPTSVVHVSAVIVPAALAAAQAAGATGADLLAALVAGNEVSTRVGAAGSGEFHARGLHPTGVCGVFGATAAAARAGRLDSRRTADALGIAGSMAAGLLEFLADGSQTKQLHAGWAAQSGLAAARLAARGATGPRTVFEGDRGFFAAYLNGFDVDLEALEGLGDRWATSEIAYKPYPACHYTHAPVDALAHLMDAEGLRVDDVERIVGLTDVVGVGLVCEPASAKVLPRTPYDAKFSLPWALAYRLVHGRLDVTSFTPDALADPRVRELTPRIGYELRQYAPTPDAFGGGARVYTRDGRVLEHELRYQRGGAENPLSEAAILEKYRTNAGLALPSEALRALEHALLGLAEAPDLRFADVLAAAHSGVDS
ncbi:MmgE/PrpD family protein [Microbacterium allomyrinae]|uniref:MmgE/PrpD family protein n=1 Tax=Microbacterium allomyrinae TaxID=2830666 RepID=A0A9X1LWV8_9MICO|nr:MmgE/PrpD family protein [Microbacterium allomyrinae]MCC2033186.1 MmgE/PrpD family protein [Microbacterium allomyrinae]